VNKTGVWNDAVLLDFTKKIVFSRQETALALSVINSYGVHIKLAKSKALEKLLRLLPLYHPI
jgi:hypothetical protein